MASALLASAAHSAAMLMPGAAAVAAVTGPFRCSPSPGSTRAASSSLSPSRCPCPWASDPPRPAKASPSLVPSCTSTPFRAPRSQNPNLNHILSPPSSHPSPLNPTLSLPHPSTVQSHGPSTTPLPHPSSVQSLSLSTLSPPHPSTVQSHRPSTHLPPHSSHAQSLGLSATSPPHSSILTSHGIMTRCLMGSMLLASSTTTSSSSSSWLTSGTPGIYLRNAWEGNSIGAHRSFSAIRASHGGSGSTEVATVEESSGATSTGLEEVVGAVEKAAAETAAGETAAGETAAGETATGEETAMLFAAAGDTAAKGEGSLSAAAAQTDGHAALETVNGVKGENGVSMGGMGGGQEKKKKKGEKGEKGKGGGKQGGEKGAKGATEKPVGSSSKEDIRALRIQKVADMRSQGKDPYAYTWPRSHRASELQKEYSHLTDGEEPLPAPSICVAGRVMAKRVMGKLAFLTIRDEDTTLQLFCAAVPMEEASPGSFAFIKGGGVDVGDIVGAMGGVKRTERGELSVTVLQLSVLTKSLLPLPDKFHGLTDVETRYRQRYLDMIVNPDVVDVFRSRAKIVSVIRRHMEDNSFVEVETPVLQSEAGGAEARPFMTHHNALKTDMFLRIATELHLKRMIVGGFDRVFEIGRIFRNEGISTRHNPEFTSIEMYQAYGDYTDMMDLAEALVEASALATRGTLTVTYQGETIELTRPWRRASMDELVRERTGVDMLELQNAPLGEAVAAGVEAVEKAFGAAEGGGGKALGSAKRKIRQCSDWGHVLNEVFEAVVEKTLVQPTFVMDHPVEISPLAKPHRSRPGLTERFELFVCGRELANAFSELTDPLDQRQRFEQQVKSHQEKRTQASLDAAEGGGGRGGEDEDDLEYDVPLDEDFLTALEYGMPPTAGMGIGIDRLVMLLTDSPSIRDVIAFPVLKATGMTNDS